MKIVISTDSHSPSDLDYMRYGVQLARKAGLSADDILNTLPLEEIMKRRPDPLPLTRVYCRPAASAGSPFAGPAATRGTENPSILSHSIRTFERRQPFAPAASP